jgi:hypothetical protein
MPGRTGGVKKAETGAHKIGLFVEMLDREEKCIPEEVRIQKSRSSSTPPDSAFWLLNSDFPLQFFPDLPSGLAGGGT